MCRGIAFILNGTTVTAEAPESTALLHVLHSGFGLTGARFGCGAEQCGACCVLVDGVPAYACTRPLWSVAGRQVTTVEGLGTPDAPHPIQRALLEEQAGQCGYCLSGIQIAAVALLARNPAPGRAEIAAALDPHLCRCGAHNRIIRAVQRAAAMLAGQP